MNSNDKALAIVIAVFVFGIGLLSAIGAWTDSNPTRLCAEACGDRGVHRVTAEVCECEVRR